MSQRRIATLFGLVGLTALVAWQRPYVAAQVGAGFTARVMCSLVLGSGLEAGAVFDGYVTWLLGPAHRLVRFALDREAGAVDAHGAWLWHARAIHRPGAGCTLLVGADEAALRAFRDPPHPPPLPSDVPWPLGEAGPAAPTPAIGAALEAALDAAFAEPEGTPGRLRRTLAVAIAHDGRLVAERYAPGVTSGTPLVSWSMAKSVIATLAGIAVGEGRLALHAPAPVPEWQSPGDPRGAVTLDQLLRQSSGLAFDETYGAINDVSRMLFTRPDAGAFAAAMPLAHPPDTFWSYSSGTSNIVARLLREALGNDLEALVAWSRAVLFDPVGMRSAYAEPDASGTFLGSSLVFATARDWARFGQLHLQDGVWNGRRVLPQGWVRYVTTPTPAAPDGRYGAHWWLNAGDPRDPARRMWPGLPREAYAARGMSGQYVVVVPSARLVVVRLGLSQAEGDDLHGIEPLVGAALDALASPLSAP
jgi:CubicO group peptidase (beta-lactamase class C family)